MEAKVLSFNELINVILNGNVEDVFNALGPIDMDFLVQLYIYFNEHFLSKE